MEYFDLKNILLIALIAPALHAMEPAEKRIKLIVGNKAFAVPQSAALQAQTLKHMTEDLGITHDIELSEKISPKIMHYAARIMCSFEKHKDLKHKALLDAIQDDVHLADLPRLDLLRVCNYLDFPAGLEFTARSIASNKKFVNQLLVDESLRDLRPLVAKYYYLLRQDIIDWFVFEKFSIQDFLDYMPRSIYTVPSSLGNWPDHTKISLSHRCLNSLAGFGAIYGLANLEELDFKSNELNALSTGIFNGLAKLRKLDLSINKLSTLPAGAFNGLINLQELNLGDNKLCSLPKGIFKDLANLRELCLYDNQLRVLPAGIFNGLASLRRVELENNQVSEENKKELRDTLPDVRLSF